MRKGRAAASEAASEAASAAVRSGLDGLMVIFPDYVDGLKMFGAEILPRLHPVPA
jgi:pyrimidine oxygenase